MRKKKTHIVSIDARLCKGTEGCGICLSVCPADVLAPAPELSDKGVHPARVMRPENCTGCELCMLYCPDLAASVEHREEDGHE